MALTQRQVKVIRNKMKRGEKFPKIADKMNLSAADRISFRINNRDLFSVDLQDNIQNSLPVLTTEKKRVSRRLKDINFKIEKLEAEQKDD